MSKCKNCNGLYGNVYHFADMTFHLLKCCHNCTFPSYRVRDGYASCINFPNRETDSDGNTFCDKYEERCCECSPKVNQRNAVENPATSAGLQPGKNK